MNKRAVKICREIARNKKGNILLITVLILSGMLAVGLGISTIVLQGIVMNRNQEFSTTAYFAAEAGAERVIWENWNNNFEINDTEDCENHTNPTYISFDDTECSGHGSGGAPCCIESATPIATSLGDKSYSILFTDIGDGTIKLKCTGSYRQVRRSVEIIY